MLLYVDDTKNHSDGFTILEVIFAIFILGLISSAIFKLISNADRIRGHALFIESATQLASDEAERVRNIAAQNQFLEDSSYTVLYSGRTLHVKRNIIESDAPPTLLAKPREPTTIELIVSNNNMEMKKSLRFKILIGYDNP